MADIIQCKDYKQMSMSKFAYFVLAGTAGSSLVLPIRAPRVSKSGSIGVPLLPEKSILPFFNKVEQDPICQHTGHQYAGSVCCLMDQLANLVR